MSGDAKRVQSGSRKAGDTAGDVAGPEDGFAKTLGDDSAEQPVANATGETVYLAPSAQDSSSLLEDSRDAEEPGSDQTCCLNESAVVPSTRLPGNPQADCNDRTLAEEADPASSSSSAADSNQTCCYDSAETPALPRLPQAESSETCCYDSAETPLLPSPRRSPAAEPSAQAGLAVPGYEILDELGRGGMGVVYKARDLRLQRLVALKMILAGAHAGAAGLARFRTEAEAVAQLQHPNIVQIYETGEHEGRPYFSLEFVEGGTLERRLAESPTPPSAAAQLVETLARTMQVAHQRGIVHRDLKPGNILLGEVNGSASGLRRRESLGSLSLPADHWSHTTVPKIADFGLAKRVNDDSSQTQSGVIIGTPSYMAPEQAEGKNKEIGPAADIYALGAILYELLTGRPPFKAARPIDTIRQVIEQEPVPPRQLEPRVPLDLETICLKCLEKDPARRYASAAALSAELLRFLAGEPILARPTPPWERVWKWGKRRPALVALLGVSLAAVLSLVLFIIWHNVSLSQQLDQARAEERLARQREQEAVEAQRLAQVKNEGEKLLDDARIAIAGRDWTNARLQLTRALTAIGSEDRLEAVKEPAQALLKQVEQELQAEADRQASLARWQQFGKLRDEAQFLGTLYTGMDRAGNLKATRAMVQQALALYGISAAKETPSTLDSCLSESQKSEILGDVYQLLLILAEVEAQSATLNEPPGLSRREDHPDKPGGSSGAEQPHLREALRLLEQALRFGTPSRAYHLRRARYLGLLGDPAAAAQAEMAAANASVLHVLDHFLVADELYRRGDFEAAIQEFGQVLRQKPAHFWAQYLNALCLLQKHRPAEARAQLSSCLAQRSDFVWLYLLRGFALGELREFEAAEADFHRALQMPLDEFSRYVLFVNRGVLRIKQERFADAVADLKAASQLKPKEYQAPVNLALAYRRLHQLDLALEQLHRAVQLEPGLAHVYRLRARLYLERQEPALALKDFEQAIQRESPDSPFLADDQVERGRLLLRDRKHLEALDAIDAALRQNKDHSLGQRLRAEALFHLGRYQEVIDAFDRYLEKGQPLESVYRARGLARAELGQYPAAIEDYTRALELRPTSVVQTYRGWAHLVCDAPRLALRDFELAIQLDPKNADAFNGRGFVLALQGRPREAIRDAEEALRLGPPSARLVYNAARIHAQCGSNHEQRAFELIQRALSLLPAQQRPAFWSSYIRADAALQSLRRQPQFFRLEAELAPRK